MKKEINDLLTLSKYSKCFAINQHFAVKATYFDEFNINTNFSSREPVGMELQLVYTLPADIWLGRATTLMGRSYEELMKEIPEKMSEMLNNLAADLSNQFKNGWSLSGKVKHYNEYNGTELDKENALLDESELDLTEQERGRS